MVEGSYFPLRQEQLDTRLQIVNAGVSLFAHDFQQEMQHEDHYSIAAANAYVSVLTRPSKRLRGMYTVTGYWLYQGEDRKVIEKASGAVEGIHTSLLAIDDCADNDSVRRGGPAVHTAISNYLEQKGASGDTAAAGVHMAIDVGLLVQYKAFQTFQDLRIPIKQRELARHIVDKRLFETGKGQLLDIVGSHVELDRAAILKAARYKTAYYTFLLPLQLGAVLAGAREGELAYFNSYAENAGLAFQLRDDVLGLFLDTSDTGKSQKSDIISNKKTLLRAETLERAEGADRKTLLAALGNSALSDEGLQNCLHIIKSTGALAETERQIDVYTQQALDSLDTAPSFWPTEQVDFLRALTMYGARRRK